MVTKNTKDTKTEQEQKRIFHTAAEFLNSATASTNPWKDVKSNTGKKQDYDDFVETVDLCRFFYKTEPIISTVINKLVEIGINDLVISKTGLSENEFRVFMALKPKLLEFAETMAQELLLSGLVVPEIGYGPVDKDTIFELGIKKYNRLIFPVSLWVRDPKTIKINSSMMSDTPSYYVTIPDDMVSFIKSKGTYPDGKQDKELYNDLKTYFPEFISDVNSGKTEVLLDNKLILRRKYLSDDPYPIPYISSVLDALQHKRELRRMDYSLIDKVIGAIMHVKMGSDDFPVTNSEEDEEAVLQLRRQLSYRFGSDQSLERIFQLITNHTVSIDWVFPDTSLLANTNKYDDINQEILFGLGFPRILITGEAERSGASDSELALISPIKTMELLRKKILIVIRDIFKTVAQENNFKVPLVKFKALNLHSFKDFIEALSKLYEVSGVSRSSMADVLGYDFKEEVDLLSAEQDILVKSGLPEFGPTPNSRNPILPEGTVPQTQEQKPNTTTKNDKSDQNPSDLGENNGQTG